LGPKRTTTKMVCVGSNLLFPLSGEMDEKG
jgi:hypothetical protein